MTASSPGPSKARHRLNRHCFAPAGDHAPAEMVEVESVVREFALAMASFKTAVPSIGVYFVSPAPNGGGRRVLDVLRRVEIRFAGAQADDVAACRAQLRREREYGTGRRGLDPAAMRGETDKLTGCLSQLHRAQSWYVNQRRHPRRKPATSCDSATTVIELTRVEVFAGRRPGSGY